MVTLFFCFKLSVYRMFHEFYLLYFTNLNRLFISLYLSWLIANIHKTGSKWGEIASKLAVKLAVKKSEKIRENYLISKLILLNISVFFWGGSLREMRYNPKVLCIWTSEIPLTYLLPAKNLVNTMYKWDEAFYLAYVLFRFVKLRAGVTLYVLVYAILYLHP